MADAKTSRVDRVPVSALCVLWDVLQVEWKLVEPFRLVSRGFRDAIERRRASLPLFKARSLRCTASGLIVYVDAQTTWHAGVGGDWPKFQSWANPLRQMYMAGLRMCIEESLVLLDFFDKGLLLAGSRPFADDRLSVGKLKIDADQWDDKLPKKLARLGAFIRCDEATLPVDRHVGAPFIEELANSLSAKRTFVSLKWRWFSEALQAKRKTTEVIAFLRRAEEVGWRCRVSLVRKRRHRLRLELDEQALDALQLRFPAIVAFDV